MSGQARQGLGETTQTADVALDSALQSCAVESHVDISSHSGSWR